MAVKFNGSSHKLVRNATLFGVTNSGKFTISGWFWSDGVATLDTFLLSGPSGSGKFNCLLTTAGEIQVVCRKPGASTIVVQCITDGAALEDSEWHHFVISCDLSVPVIHFRIDGIAPTVIETTLTVSETIDFESPTAWRIGANISETAWSDFALEDLVFKTGQFVDISDLNTLELFISSDGRAASGDLFWQNVGPNAGRKPVGYGVGAPIFNGEKADVYFSNSFQSNLGTGGAFVVSGLPFDTPTNAPNVYRHAAQYDNKERWFDSELTGFSYTRSRTFIEQREGHPKKGLRMGVDERDEHFRQERPADSLNQLLFNDREDDTEEWDR